MTVRLYAMSCGQITLPLGAFLAGEAGTIKIPVPSYLIVHPKGKVLYDTGLNLAAQADAEGYLGGKAKHFTLHYQPGEELTARLALLDLDVRDVSHLVMSHLHFDHCGGCGQIPNAPLVIQAREWAAGQDPDLAAANGYMAKDYDLGHDVQAIEGEHDIFGDGSVVCLPTYGHTPGHQSLKVRLASGDVVLAGDACYLRRSLEELHLPGQCHDEEATLASFKILRDLEARGARIFYGHDPDFWKTVPQAPAELV